MQSYVQFLSDHRDASKEEFLARVEVPHLLLALESSGGDGEDTEDTRKILTDEWNMEAERLRALQMLWIVPVRKTSQNVFADMITIGRAANNDLVFPKPSLSKFHAYLTTHGGSWSLTDAGSRNGTTLDGVRLTPRQAYPLRSGASIELGRSTPAEFLLPPDLYARLKLEGPQLLDQREHPTPPAWNAETLKELADANPDETLAD